MRKTCLWIRLESKGIVEFLQQMVDFFTSRKNSWDIRRIHEIFEEFLRYSKNSWDIWRIHEQFFQITIFPFWENFRNCEIQRKHSKMANFLIFCRFLILLKLRTFVYSMNVGIRSSSMWTLSLIKPSSLPGRGRCGHTIVRHMKCQTPTSIFM